MTDTTAPNRALRFAVVGQGHFAQTAILPAFRNAQNVKLVAIFSSDEGKLAELKNEYQVDFALPYEQYDDFLRSGQLDAVYIALPNDMHCEYTVRAAAAHVHVLCEKPMAVTSEECERMIAACEQAKVKLMIAYRLHFEEANLSTIELLASGKLGQPRYFTSAFSQQTNQGIRTSSERGGGPLYDIGIYCINAARYLFRAEPLEVLAVAVSKEGDERFRDIDEQLSVVMTFPEQRLGSFTCSFGATKHGYYDVVCTEGRVRLDPAYHHASDLRQQVTTGAGKTRSKTFKKRDQIAAELVYFADTVLNDRAPEPSGHEGLADLRVIEAIQESIERRAPVAVKGIPDKPRPTGEQEQEHPAPDKPPTVHTQPPSNG